MQSSRYQGDCGEPWSNPLAFCVVNVPAMFRVEGFVPLFIGNGYAAVLMARLGECDGEASFQMCIEEILPDEECPHSHVVVDGPAPMTSDAAWVRSQNAFAIEAAVVIGRLDTPLSDPAVRGRLAAALDEMRALFLEQIASGHEVHIDPDSPVRLHDALPAANALLDEIAANSQPRVLH